MTRFLAAAAVLFLVTPRLVAEEPFRYPEGKHGKGELKYVNGVPVLTVAGTPEEIGGQIGVLGLKPLAPHAQKMLHDLVGKQAPLAWSLAVKLCEGLYSRFPEEYRRELEAMAKASGIDRSILIVGNTVSDLKHLGSCSAFVVEPARSATGGLIFGRNFDFPPVGDLAKYGMVIVYRPEGKRAFATISFPGALIGGTAMNAKGLIVAGNDVTDGADRAPVLNPEGTAVAVAGRRLMEGCDDLAAADAFIDKLSATVSGAVIVADTRSAAVYEVTTKNVVRRPSEDGVCLCTNHFRTEKLAISTNCRRYGVLEKFLARPKFGVKDVAEAMHAANQGAWTMQSMVFEPAALRVHVAVGPGPVTKNPLRRVELGRLLKGNDRDE